MSKKPRRLAPMLRDMASCLFKKPATRQYPVVKVEAETGYRGRHILYPEKCISCSLCEKDCPANAIELVEVAGKRMPMFYLDRCVFCYQCVESCPREAIKMSTNFELSTTEREEMLVKPDEFVSKEEETVASEG
jgi:formate hydrogenlyase subunit 6/NADH:ubiquinone oxidoreductase subunit I